MKRNALETQATTGPEQLSNIHDFRIHDLELELEPDFPLFAAEILFLLLSLASDTGLAETDFIPVDPVILRDPGRLKDRRSAEYVERVRQPPSPFSQV